MAIGLVGRKSGMTRVFTEDGASVPVTVVEVSPNRVTQIKEQDTDGYRAIQVTAGNRKTSKVSKSEAGHFAKAGVEAGSGLWEFRLEDADEARMRQVRQRLQALGMTDARLQQLQDSGQVEQTLRFYNETGNLWMLITLGALPNLLAFFGFLRLKRDYRARGVLLATFVAAITAYLIYFF